MYQANLNGDQLTFTELREITEELSFWWKPLPKFETKTGPVTVYYDKGVVSDVDDLWHQCQNYFN